MIEFNYAALDEAGQMVQGRVQAPGKDAAIAAIQHRRWVLLSLTENAAVRVEGPRRRAGRKASVPTWELSFLAEQIATLLEGGLPLLKALSMQQSQARNPALAEALEDVTKQLGAGTTLAACLAAHEGVFPRLWPAMVRVGETSGALPHMLKQISAFHEMQDEVRSRVSGALLYPCIVMTLSLAILAFFIARVVPSFAEIFESYGAKIPPLTAGVIYGARALKEYFALLVAAGVLAWTAARVFLSTRAGARAWDGFLLRVPFINDFYTAFQTQRFVSALGLMLSSGIPVVRSFEVLAELFEGQPLLREAIHAAQTSIMQGKSLSAALGLTGRFPSLVVDMAATGEESGRLNEMLAACNRYYLKRMDQFLKRFGAVVEPVLVVLVGGVVVVIVMAIMLPVMSLTKIH